MKNSAFYLITSVFILILLSLSTCKKEDDMNKDDPSDTIQNPIDTPRTWNLPWPKWIFYHWVWEDESTQQSATALIDDYLAHDIPVGAIIIDSPWETGYSTFEWDNTLFPDPQGMIDYIHSKDVRVLMWMVTAINLDVDSLYNYAAAQEYFMQRNSNSGPAVIDWWKGDGSNIDFFNPDAVTWWKGLMDKVLDMGIDGWKCDGTDYFTLELLGNNYSPHLGQTVSRLEYSHAYYRLFHDYTRERLGNDRVNLARPVDNYGTGLGGDLVSFAPIDINWAGWVGDQDATFNGLRSALNNMYHSAEMGYLAFGSDIGGYREESIPNGREKEVFIRWAQLGAFSPIMENGGGGEHRPWMFDQETTDIYRTLVKLHHAMVPYFMDQSEIYFNNEESLMQFFNTSDYSYLLGPDIFVTPFKATGTSINIQFPSGDRWVYLYDNTKVYDGGTAMTLDISLEEFPVFIKEGSSLIDILDISKL